MSDRQITTTPRHQSRGQPSPEVQAPRVVVGLRAVEFTFRTDRPSNSRIRAVAACSRSAQASSPMTPRKRSAAAGVNSTGSRVRGLVRSVATEVVNPWPAGGTHRRSAAEHDLGVHDLRVRLLGDVQVEGCDSAALGRRQARTLLKILALHHGHPVAIDRLADCLWVDEQPARAADQISVLVSRLRGVVGADRIRRTDAGYTMTVDWLDVDALEEYANETEWRLASGAIAGGRAAASAGLALIRGPLLADEPDPWWAEAERSRADRLVGRLYHAAAAGALAAGDATEATMLAEGAMAADPFDEAALRLLLAALVRSGRPASALAAYAAFRARLAEELGVSPSPETEAVHEAILLGTDRPGAPDQVAADLDRRPAVDLPGRADAIARLDAILDRAVAGHGQVGVIEGEAGIGKSALLGAFGLRAEDQAVTVVQVSGDELGRTLPLQPLLDVVEELIRRRGADGANAADDVIGPDAAVLGPLLGFQRAPAAAAQLAALTDPGAGQALVFAAVSSVLRRQAEQGPLAVLIDDLHLAGPATAAWLAQAVRRLADCRVAIVAARREEEGAPVPGVEAIRLGPLDLDAAALVVGEERASELHARSGGHPLFLVELAAAGAGAGAGEGDELPATIRQAVEGRCARAGPAAVTLRTAAVIDTTVDLDLLAVVTGERPAVLLDHLEEGARRRILVEGSTFGFTHALVREALASTVGATRSAFIHREAGRALSQRPGADPLIVAHHARLGGDLELASASLTVAARGAVARFSQDAAAGLLDEAIALHDTADARIERARVLSILMRYTEAQDDIGAAQAMGAGAEALEAGAWAAHFQRRFPEALALADQGAAQATTQADGGELRASCLALGGWVSLVVGDLPGAGSRLTLAVEEQPGNRLAQAWLGWLRVNQGRPDDAAALVHPEPTGGLAAYRFPNMYALMAGTMALAMLGRPDEALATVETLRDEMERMGAARWSARPLNLRAWIVRNLGEATEADELNQAALEDAGRLDMAEPLANGLLDLAAGRLMAGDLDGTRSYLDEAELRSEVEHAFRWRHQLRSRLLRARLDLAAGDPSAALSRAEALIVDTVAIGAARCEVQARLVAAMATATAAAGGPPADRAEVQGLLDRLALVAGIESWWLTADVAAAFGVDAWADLARRRVATLLPRADRYRDALARAADRRLG
jgi:DNA-binding SARP family transcriptional activator/tetratricopeptide (TPR) repeat protein